jgi:hypothetical protein
MKFNLTSLAGDRAQLLWGTRQGETGIACYALKGKVYAGVWPAAGSGATVLVGRTLPKKWQHVALVFDRKAKQLTTYYRPDLKTLKQVHRVDAIPAVGDQLLVGNAPFQLIHEKTEVPIAPTVGMIDDVHVFARTLSESDGGMLGHTYALDPKQLEAVRTRRADEAARAAAPKKKKKKKE